jgi:prepilin-type N-terminal cleavage/methylation domain-containing protein
MLFNKKQSGFTLVEMIVSITIMSILFTVMATTIRTAMEAWSWSKIVREASIKGFHEMRLTTRYARAMSDPMGFWRNTQDWDTTDSTAPGSICANDDTELLFLTGFQELDDSGYYSWETSGASPASSNCTTTTNPYIRFYSSLTGNTPHTSDTAFNGMRLNAPGSLYSTSLITMNGDGSTVGDITTIRRAKEHASFRFKRVYKVDLTSSAEADNLSLKWEVFRRTYGTRVTHFSNGETIRRKNFDNWAGAANYAADLNANETNEHQTWAAWRAAHGNTE